MKFNSDTFAKVMKSKWDKKDRKAMEYKEDGHKYRTWKPDSSLTSDELGILVTTKMDVVRSAAIDDHMVLQLSFDSLKNLIQGQVAVQMEREDSILSGTIDDGTEGARVDVAVEIVANVRSQLKKYGMFGSNAARQAIPDVIDRNIKAIVASIETTK